jgi:hypothetical protein
MLHPATNGGLIVRGNRKRKQTPAAASRYISLMDGETPGTGSRVADLAVLTRPGEESITPWRSSDRRRAPSIKTVARCDGIAPGTALSGAVEDMPRPVWRHPPVQRDEGALPVITDDLATVCVGHAGRDLWSE